ncbi:MAG: hypothetical protein HQK71_01255 [Desulfamplus sp.]|nr:hypothetical protein [Desulfamplus sp.]
MKDDVTIFKPYPFKVGQKMRIDGSGRNGDWEVVDIGTNKMTIRCPISHKELKCDKFCFFVEERINEDWPKIEN